MSSRKRRLSSDPSPASTKKPATAPVVNVDDEEDDSLESILARIKAHEESEALAQRLHQEWNDPSGNSNSVSPSPFSFREHSVGASCGTRTGFAASAPEDAIVISDGDSDAELVPEDDEAMARRLAEQWEIEDSALYQSQPMLSTSTSHYGNATKGKVAKAKHLAHLSQSIDDHDATPAAHENLPAVSKLEQCKDLFMGNKACSSCGAALPSPRGYVNSLSTASITPSSLI